MKTFTVKTEYTTEIVDITEQVQEMIIRSGIKEGVCTVFVPHTTASVFLFENVDPNLKRDILRELSTVVSEDHKFTHTGTNARAHIKSAIMGASINLIVHNGQAILGEWQGILLGEFDGPRERTVHVKVM